MSKKSVIFGIFVLIILILLGIFTYRNVKLYREDETVETVETVGPGDFPEPKSDFRPI